MRTHAALAATLLLTLTACGTEAVPDKPADKPGQSTPAEQPPAETGEAALETAVRAYSAAYFKPDAATAHSMLSKRCAAKVDPAVYKALVENTVQTLGAHDIKTLTVDQISGDLARVTYTYDVPTLSQSGQPWAREGGAWKYDAC